MKPAAHVSRVLAVSLLIMMLGPAMLAASKSSNTDTRKAVQELTTRFLTAFENLDLDAFMACFAPDATVFFPTPEPPQRFDGKEAIRDHFFRVFSAIRKSSTAREPPFHRLRPEDTHIQLVGSDVAVVTFHLRNSERIARRTLVVGKRGDSWLISHLHASNVPVAPSPDTLQH